MSTPGEIRDGYLRSHDGLKLYYRERIVPDAKAHILMVHGVGEHYGRYRETERFFAEQGYSMSIMDLRGHGQSEGKRVYIPSFECYLQDLDAFVAQVASRGNNTFMIGHSLGGIIAVRYVETRRPGFRGLITSGAALRASVKPPALVFKALERVNKLYGATPVPGLVKPEQISRDPDIVARYKADPLVPKFMTTQFGMLVLDECQTALDEASEITIPTLVMHGGGDTVASPAGSEELFERLTVQDKSIAIYPRLYHEIFNEPERLSVLGDVIAWVGERAQA